MCDFRQKSAVLRFWDPFVGLGETYDNHLRLIGKHVVDFLLVLCELFSLGVTAESLRANIGWKSAISLQQGPVDPKFQVEGVRRTAFSSLDRVCIVLTYLLTYSWISTQRIWCFMNGEGQLLSNTWSFSKKNVMRVHEKFSTKTCMIVWLKYV